jgi:RpiR family transcriptional regulator, carbohydrate utilization regulator
MLNTIRALIPNLTKSEQRVARQLLDNPGQLLQASISELARQWQVSEPTLVRFSRALGCSGFQDLRVRLAQELGGQAAQPGPRQALGLGDSGAGVIDKVFTHAASALQQVRQGLAGDAVNDAVLRLDAARRVMLFAHGPAVHIAHEAATRFLRLDMPVMVFGDFTGQAQMSALAQSGDVVLLLSLSGRAPEWLRHVETLGQREAEVLAITTSGSPLARAVPRHIALNVPESTDAFMPDLAPLASLLLLESLALGVALRRGKALARRLKRAAG